MCTSDLHTKQICEKAREKKLRVYMGFIDLEKAYDRINREALWKVLRMYDVGGKLLSEIESMYVDSLACVRVKGHRIDSGVRKGVSCLLGCSMHIWME